MVQPVSTYRTAASPPFQSRLPPPHFSLPARPPAPTARLVPHLPPTTNSGGIEVIQRRREQLEVQQEWQAGARSSSTSRSSSERASQQGKEEGAAGGELRQASEGTMKLVGAAPMEAQTSSERSSGAPSVESSSPAPVEVTPALSLASEPPKSPPPAPPPPPTPYFSPHAFLAEVNRQLSTEEGGAPALLWQKNDLANEARVLCSVVGCPWVVGVERGGDGRWMVQEVVGSSVHDHRAAGGEVAIEPRDGQQQRGVEVVEKRTALDIVLAEADDSDLSSLCSSDEEDSDEADSDDEQPGGNPAEDHEAWSLPLEGKEIRALVQSRQDVFAKQRGFNDAEKQRQSKELALEWSESYVQVPNGRFSAEGYRQRRYEAFCAEMDVPPYPVTPSLATLFVLYTTLTSTGSLRHLLNPLNLLRKATMEVWEGVEGAEESLGEQNLHAQPAYAELYVQYPVGAKGVKSSGLSSPSPPSSPARSRLAPHPRNGVARPSTKISSIPGSLSPTSAAPSALPASSDHVPSSPESDSDNPMAIPHSPQVGDRFADEDALKAHWWQHVVPVLGVGLSKSTGPRRLSALGCNRRSRVPCCPYRVVLSEAEDGNGLVVDDASTLVHNHGPMPQILRDPEWRPWTRGPRVREGRQTEVFDQRQQAIPAGAQESSDDDDEDLISEARLTPHFSPVKRASSSVSSSTTSTFKRLKSDHRPSPAFAPALPTSFLQTLTTFLTSLSPSLATHAPTLLRAGVDDVEHLVLLLGMEEASLEGFLKEAGVPVLARTMVKGRVRKARVGGWMAD